MNLIEGYFVRMEGLEPPCLAALDPKSSASTNSATSADKFKNLFRMTVKLKSITSNNRNEQNYNPVVDHSIGGGLKNGMQK